MITFAQSKLPEAQRVLLELGFSQQHSRIFHYRLPEESVVFQCVLGLEEVGADYEVSLALMQRPNPKNKKAIALESVRVIEVDEAPEALQEVLQQVESALENL
jgi:hypothetical protein